MQVDPIKDGLNWLAYTGDNPVNKIDPMGLITLKIYHAKGTTKKFDVNDIIGTHLWFEIDGDYFGYGGEGGYIDNESGLQKVTYQESDEIERVCSRLKINRKQECCLRKHAVKIYKSFSKKNFQGVRHNCTQYAMKVLKSCGFNVIKYPLVPSWDYKYFVSNN